MSLICTLLTHNKVRTLIDEAHEERKKNGPPPSLGELLVLTFLGQFLKKAEDKKKAAQPPTPKDTAS
jgi:hypothetical protein